MMLPALTQEISCSVLRPPKTMATRVLPGVVTGAPSVHDLTGPRPTTRLVVPGRQRDEPAEPLSCLALHRVTLLCVATRRVYPPFPDAKTPEDEKTFGTLRNHHGDVRSQPRQYGTKQCL